MLDGLGAQHWKGANEPQILRPKFLRLSLESSTVKDLKLKNCPNNCIMLYNSKDLLVSNINIDNYDGYPVSLVDFFFTLYLIQSKGGGRYKLRQKH